MMEWLNSMLTRYPELAVYLALGVGYWVGSLKFGKFSLGGATGSLLAGIGIGLLFKVPIPGMSKSIVFLMFLFGIGYEVGPRFFGGMKGTGWRFVLLGSFVPVVGLFTAWAVARGMGLDLGFSAGMMSGGLTESPAMGTAAEAINALKLDAALTEKLVAHIGVADALCYVGGALGVILMCSTIGPWLLRIDVREEAVKLEASLGIKRNKAGIFSAWQPFVYRAYRVDPAARVVGKTVAEAERLIPDTRLFVQRLRRGDAIIEAEPATRIEAGDVAVICGRSEVVVETLGELAQEVNDRELLDIPVASFEIFVTSKAAVGRRLGEMAKDDAVRGVFLKRLVRYGQDIPIGLQTVVQRGDVMHVVGSETAVLRVARILGEVVSPTETTDFVAVGLAIFVGAVLGAAAAFTVGGVQVSIGTSVGVLVAGIVTGYLRSVRPLFGHVPDGAVKFMQSIGLAGFVAMVGIGAGPHFIEGVREVGVRVLMGGLIVTMTPLVAGLYFGRYVLKINPLLLLGALAGAQTFTPGLAAVQEKSGSSIAVLGYSGAVPIGHILLTVWGTAIILLLS
jgi:putative transport protein